MDENDFSTKWFILGISAILLSLHVALNIAPSPSFNASGDSEKMIVRKLASEMDQHPSLYSELNQQGVKFKPNLMFEDKPLPHSDPSQFITSFHLLSDDQQIEEIERFKKEPENFVRATVEYLNNSPNLSSDERISLERVLLEVCETKLNPKCAEFFQNVIAQQNVSIDEKITSLSALLRVNPESHDFIKIHSKKLLESPISTNQKAQIQSLLEN